MARNWPVLAVTLATVVLLAGGSPALGAMRRSRSKRLSRMLGSRACPRWIFTPPSTMPD